MYFAEPLRPHATIVSVGISVPVPCRLAGLVQSSVAKRAFNSGEIPPIGVAASTAVPPMPAASANT